MTTADGRSRPGRPLAGRGRTRDPHRRYDPLLDEWVLVSAGRTRSPVARARRRRLLRCDRPAYEPACYLCPGNARANGDVNPAYESTFVFTNDFSALRPDTSTASFVDGLLRAEGRARGVPRRVLLTAP